VDYPKSMQAGAVNASEHSRFSARAARWLAYVLWAAAAAQAVLGLLLAALNQLTLRRFFAEYVVANTASALSFATVGLLIAARRPRSRIGWLLCAAGFAWGLGGWVGQYARYALVTRAGTVPGGDLAAWANMWLGVLIITLTAIYLPLLFPDGRLPSGRWRAAGWLAAFATALFTVVQAISPGPIDASLPEVSNPFAPAGAEMLMRVLGPIAVGAMLASMICAVAAPIVRFRRADGPARQQIKWFAYATALLIATIVLPALLDPSGIADPAKGDTFWSGVAVAVGFPFLALAVGVAILRHRLYDIDVIINRTLVYGGLTACVVALYVVVVGYLGTLFNARGNVLVSLVATGIVAVLFQPLRERLQRAVNRMMFGERDDPYAVLARLGQRMEATLAPDAVLPTIVQTVKDALKLPYVAIALSGAERRTPSAEEASAAFDTQGSTLTALVAEGDPAGELLAVPLTYQGETVGQLLLSPRAAAEPWGAADRRLLDDLARLAVVAVHAVRLHTRAVQLAADLQQSRERLVTAREEERRRLRRDLHDGLGPALAGLTLKLDAAHDELYEDVDSAAAMLRDLKRNVQEAIADIRRLVYALRPPALDELGLVAALQVQVAGYRQSALRVSLDAPPNLPQLPAAVEVAAYRIVAEALTNVARHAQAARCDIRLALADALELEVIDDGRGLPSDYQPGVGLISMRERAEELGGTCEAKPAPGGGTLVRARLPIH
jgi:signal transduction histidine kinase